MKLRKFLGNTLVCSLKQIDTGRSMVIESGHITTESCFVWPRFARKLLASRTVNTKPEICRSFNRETNGYPRSLYFCCISLIRENIPGLLSADSCHSLPAKAEVIQHILVIAGSRTGHDGTADLMVTDGALRRPRSCLLTGHKRYTRNTVISWFCSSRSKRRRHVFSWMSESLRGYLGAQGNQAGF